MRKLAYLAVALSVVLPTTMPAAFASTVEEQAEQARPMTPVELRQLYGNKSWVWKTGFGYFSVKQRRFTSALRDGSYAEGKWFVAGDGKLCFRADWHEKAGVYRNVLSCLAHRINDRGVIYQRRVPDGDWYIFRHVPVRKSDEYRTFKPGNYVQKLLERNKRRLGG